MPQYSIYNVDCYEYLQSLPEIDAIVTDPPYGINVNKMNLGSRWKVNQVGESWDVARPDLTPFLGACKYLCFWGGNYFTDVLPPTDRWLVWHKVNDGRSFSEAELAWTNYSKRVRTYHRNWAHERKEHPTQKPLSVMLWCLSLLPKDARIVFDPFMGAGTIGTACMQLGLDYIGCEINRKYYEIAQRRIGDAASQATLFSSLT